MSTAAEVIRILDLKSLEAEGGYFRETYRSPLSTAIYYLLTPETFSAMHRLPGDEIFHFYLGDVVEMIQLHADGSGSLHILGHELKTGMQPQIVVPGGTWQGSRLLSGGAFALMGTSMAPPFRYGDYETGNREALTKTFPKFAEHIRKLTRE